MRGCTLAVGLVLSFAYSHAGLSLGQDERAEESARAQFRSAVEFVREAKYQEALRDFQAIVNNFPTSSVADNAYLEVAKYKFEVAGDVTGAQEAISQLELKYNGSDATPMGHVLAGQIKIATAYDIESLESAIAEFDRVLRRFPRDEAVPPARLYRAVALQVANRDTEALAELNTIIGTQSNSKWAARARVTAARSHVRLHEPLQAIRELQFVRSHFPGTPEAAAALDFNTLLARLYVRLPATSSFALSPTASVGGGLRDVIGLVRKSDGSTIVAAGDQVVAFEPDGSSRVIGRGRVSALAVDPWNRPVMIGADRSVRWGMEREFVLRVEKPRPKNMSDKVDNPNPEYWYVDNPKSLVITPTDVIVADDTRGLVRFSTTGQYVGVFSGTRVDRLIRDDFGHLLGLDK